VLLARARACVSVYVCVRMSVCVCVCVCVCACVRLTGPSAMRVYTRYFPHSSVDVGCLVAMDTYVAQCLRSRWGVEISAHETCRVDADGKPAKDLGNAKVCNADTKSIEVGAQHKGQERVSPLELILCFRKSHLNCNRGRTPCGRAATRFVRLLNALLLVGVFGCLRVFPHQDYEKTKPTLKLLPTWALRHVVKV
jgi:hypothetical protein